MPRMTVNELVKDPEFWDLSQESQLQVMGKIDPRFSNLSFGAKNTVLQRLTPKTQFPEQPVKPQGDHWSREVARVGGGIVGGVAAAALPEPAKFLTGMVASSEYASSAMPMARIPRLDVLLFEKTGSANMLMVTGV